MSQNNFIFFVHSICDSEVNQNKCPNAAHQCCLLPPRPTEKELVTGMLQRVDLSGRPSRSTFWRPAPRLSTPGGGRRGESGRRPPRMLAHSFEAVRFAFIVDCVLPQVLLSRRNSRRRARSRPPHLSISFNSGMSQERLAPSILQ